MEKKKRKEWIRSYAWSAPSLLLIGLMVVFPILYTFYISLTNMNVYHWFDFTLVGLDNYIRALFVFDSGFLSALLATILWTVVSMILQLVIAFLLANLLNIEKLRLRKLYHARICGDPALENRNVQHPVWPVESMDGQAGADGGQVAFFRCIGISELHGGQSVAGAAIHDHDYGRGIAEH